MEEKHDRISTFDNHPIITIFYELAQLKNLYRQGWLKRDVTREDCESVADHSFSVALLGYIIATEYRKDLDPMKVMRLGLFHELGEIRGGDITPHDNISPKDKSAREYAAAQQTVQSLPHAKHYLEIWREYEDNKTPEAIFVHEIDKLEMAMQAKLYEQCGYKNLEEFFPYVKERLSSPELKEILERIISSR